MGRKPKLNQEDLVERIEHLENQQVQLLGDMRRLVATVEQFIRGEAWARSNANAEERELVAAGAEDDA